MVELSLGLKCLVMLKEKLSLGFVGVGGITLIDNVGVGGIILKLNSVGVGGVMLI